MSKRLTPVQTDAFCRTLYAKITATSDWAYPVLLTTDGSLKIAGTGYDSIISGRLAVALTGSAVPLTTSSIACDRIDLSADLGNDNPVVVGGASVAASSGTIRGIVLIPGNTPFTIPINNLNKLYVAVQTAGDAICFNYYAY